MYKVAIRRNSDGVIRIYEYPGDWDDASDFYWTEGNLACDCTRADFFASVNNESDPNIECGDTAYSCLYAQLPDGTKIGLDDA